MKSTKIILCLTACSLLAISSATAQVVWNGGGADDNWSTADNWVGGIAPSQTNNITFSGTTRQTNIENIGGLTRIGNLILENGGWDISLGLTSNLPFAGVGNITATGNSTLRGNFSTGDGNRTITLNGTAGTTTLTIADKLTFGRANNSATLSVNGAGNTLLLGSLEIGAGNGNQTISGTANVTVSGAVTETINTGIFAKNGTGTLTFNGSYTSNNATTINGGTMFINGDALTATGAFTVGADGTLGGIGMIGGATTVDGTLAAGQNDVGKLTFANTLTLNTITVMEIDGLAGAGVSGGHDFVDLTGVGALGVLTYGGALTLDIGTILAASASWNLFDFASATGTFDSITLADQYSGSLLDGNTDGIWELVDGTHSWTFTESTGVLGLTVIPEPATALLGGFGLLLLLRRRR